MTEEQIMQELREMSIEFEKHPVIDSRIIGDIGFISFNGTYWRSEGLFCEPDKGGFDMLLGYFDTPEQAIEAINEAAEEWRQHLSNAAIGIDLSEDDGTKRNSLETTNFEEYRYPENTMQFAEGWVSPEGENGTVSREMQSEPRSTS